MTLWFRFEDGPWVQVVLRGPRGRTPPLAALLDSGADYSVVPRKIAADIHLPLSRRTYALGGVGGTLRAHKSVAHVTLRDGFEEVSLERVPVYVPAKGERFESLLLGRAGVFARFRIVLDEAHDLIALDPVGRAPRQVPEA